MDPLNLVIFAVLAVLFLVLVAGLFTLFRGGDFGRSYSNKLMRLRVLVQFVAILLLAGVLWWRTQS
ncbi:twin transmembrane helix small protein [Phenylobacterium sp.]|uniref:twin transmembrane helix small protein n=1 Tax=Phenylobacterium sp. TaxID=1871053 RepID=UPI002811CE51|nr:twin transmembrane helix small protein [Phenylobacterium sp.]